MLLIRAQQLVLGIAKTALAIAAGTALTVDAALAQPPAPPQGAGAGRWVLISDTTDTTFKSDAGPSIVRSQAVLAGAAGSFNRAGGVVSGDAQRGAINAGRPSIQAAGRLNGTAAAKSLGGTQTAFDALLTLAAKSPDLLDSAGSKAWKLTRHGKALAFNPYDASGAVRKDKAVVVDGEGLYGEGEGGRVLLGGFDGSRLSGAFRNKLTMSDSSALAAL
jgi:hypothetical protein